MRACVCEADTLYPIIWSYEMSHCFNFDKIQYPNLPFKYLEIEVDNENIIYPIHVRIQKTNFQLCRDGSSWVEPVISKD